MGTTRKALAAIALTFQVAACSASASGPSLGEEPEVKGGRDPETPTSNIDRRAPSPVADVGAGGGSTSPASTTPIDLPPPPAAGPGSTSSAARSYFLSTAFPKLQATCGTCHTAGVAGAPVFLDADAAKAYQRLDVVGYITGPTKSRLVAKGTHYNGAAKSLTEFNIEAEVVEWLNRELRERGGDTKSIWTKLQTCVTVAEWTPVNDAINAMRTQRRNNENADNCTGCNQARCSTCHGQTEYGFLANNNLNQPPAQHFPRWIQDELFLQQYIGTNGEQLVPSTKLKAKEGAVATGLAYSHPLFKVPATVDAALTKLATDVAAKYAAKQCGQ